MYKNRHCILNQFNRFLSNFDNVNDKGKLYFISKLQYYLTGSPHNTQISYADFYIIKIL